MWKIKPERETPEGWSSEPRLPSWRCLGTSFWRTTSPVCRAGTSWKSFFPCAASSSCLTFWVCCLKCFKRLETLLTIQQKNVLKRGKIQNTLNQNYIFLCFNTCVPTVYVLGNEWHLVRTLTGYARKPCCENI